MLCITESLLKRSVSPFKSLLRVGLASDYDGPNIKLFILVGWGRNFVSVAWLRVSVSYSAPRDLHRRAAYSSFLIHQGDYHDLFVCP